MAVKKQPRVLSKFKIQFDNRPWRYHNYEFDMELLACQSCGTKTLAFTFPDGSGQRITGHKCAGAWTALEKFRVAFDQKDIELFAGEFMKAQGESR